MKLKQIGRIGKLKIWLVDGNEVCEKYKPDFIEGGHDAVYSWMPKNEVWIDDRILVKDRFHVLMHELYERELMNKTPGNWPYLKAHEKANKMEWALRRNPILGRRQHHWGVIATACEGTGGLEIAYCPLCNKYEAYGREESEKALVSSGKAKIFAGHSIRVNKKVALEIASRCTCPEFSKEYPIHNVLTTHPPAEERRRRYAEMRAAGLPREAALKYRDYRPTRYSAIIGDQIPIAPPPKYRWWKYTDTDTIAKERAERAARKNPIKKESSLLGLAAIAGLAYLLLRKK